MYLLCRCICIFELATSCGQRTITFLSYSEAVVRLPCRATSRPNSRCRYKGLRLPFRRRPIWREIYHRSFIYSSAVDFCGLLRFQADPSRLWSLSLSVHASVGHLQSRRLWIIQLDDDEFESVRARTFHSSLVGLQDVSYTSFDAKRTIRIRDDGGWSGVGGT